MSVSVQWHHRPRHIPYTFPPLPVEEGWAFTAIHLLSAPIQACLRLYLGLTSGCSDWQMLVSA